ncbi:MAG: DUF2797 domain-containing protein [Candidatus Nanoarchaeia archaeon]|nr:DUF2797 domain-containing protein [Candidatus Haiyanarchaeum thermophilum]MCW1303246.1 DUF2797 domain-containing protein [Candidatus Haiyanarchaeum thermophilum]MCW1304022.1 DUF2797 domain-containing protein [Candidatus Haiyanarchaeum thermophilum]MCW1306406.1 DUF2797 domain-containing protein [Candidatus Haiyanarchaeum thermophilum]MCW1307296.1 DUF2797 domain-containing protein [Candidatus Haiyanarchaeum thermophilum]
MNRTYHAIGRKCKLVGGKATYFLFLRSKNGMKLMELKPGSYLDLELLRRRCLGYYDGTYHPCDSILKFPALRCSNCEEKHILKKCLQCKGSCLLPRNVRRKFGADGEHIIYLVEFGKLLKVGVTKKGRVMERWLEQGADAGCVLGSGNCEEMIGLERRLSTYYFASIPTEWKVKFLFYKGPVSMQDLRKYYTLPSPVSLFPYPKGKKLSGEILGVKGEILLLKRNGHCFWVDLDHLIGWEFTSQKLS